MSLTAFVRLSRCSLVLAYAMAIVLSFGAHGHGYRTGPAVPPTAISHDDPAPRVTSDSATPSGHAADDCPVCHFRAQVQTDPGATITAFAPLLVESVSDLDSSLPRPVTVLRLACRAPPGV